MHTPRVPTTGTAVLLALSLVACGGGSSNTAPLDTAMGITSWAPDGVWPSEGAQPFTLTGFGLEPIGGTCTVRFTASSGTPFHHGSAAVLEGAGDIVDAETIQGVLDAAEILPVTGPVQAALEVEMPDGVVIPAPEIVVTFAELVYQLLLLDVSPALGEQSGGEVVTLTGAGFTRYDPGTPQVWFGDAQATDVAVIDDETLTCLTPPAPAGRVDVRIENAYGTATLAEAFTYRWIPRWEDDYGDLVASASDHEHPYVNNLLPMGFVFPLYGVAADRVTLHSGWLTVHQPLIPSHIGEIHVLGDCLNTEEPDAYIHLNQLPDRVVLTYDHVGWGHDEPGVATSQVVLHASGAFALMWREVIESPLVTVGILLDGAATDYVDWTSAPVMDGVTGLYEIFDAANPFDLDGIGLLFEPDGAGGYALSLFLPDPP